MALTLAELARHKKLQPTTLQAWGLEEKGKVVLIPYLDTDGKLLFKRRRTGLDGNKSTRQPSGVPPAPYGLARLKDAREEGYLIFVEGESDVWTLSAHDYPALGFPGAGTTATLKKEHVEGIKDIYLLNEEDEGSETFVRGAAERLGTLGWEGDLWVMSLTGGKDPSEVYCKAPRLFKSAIDAAIAAALPRELPPPAKLIHVNGKDARPPEGFSDELRIAIPHWPAPIHRDAMLGIAGEIVSTIDPYTEADPAAVLLSFLTAFGCACGRYTYYPHEASRHYPNLYTVLVGRSALSRKGTSWAWITMLFDAMTAPGFPDRMCTGLSSSEGLVEAVSDPVSKQERTKNKDGTYTEETVLVDPGVSDKRLLVVEEEFSSVLRQMDRQGNTLSQYLRTLWDRGRAGHVRRNCPRKTTDAHVSVVGHITVHELQATMRQVSCLNGFANRFLWVCTRRSKEIPRSQGIPDLTYHRAVLSERLEAVTRGRELTFDAGAAALWDAGYRVLTSERPGYMGDILSRSAPQAVRLALVYALLEGARSIEEPHLRAALAVWDYCQRSAEYVFREGTGDPVADEILLALEGKPMGLSLTEIQRDVFKNHQSGKNIAAALGLLMEHGLVKEVITPTKGRKLTTYVLPKLAKEAKEAKEHTA